MKIQNIPSSLKAPTRPLCIQYPPPSTSATTGLFWIPVVLHFPKCHANGHLHAYVATAFCAWLLLNMTGSLSIHGFPLHPCFSLEAFLKKPDHLFHRVSHSLDFADCIPQGVASEKPQKSSCSYVTCIWGLTLDRRFRKARSEGF